MPDFNDAIARITIEGTPIRGTGFLVANDLVATALHVVADRGTEPPNFYPGAIHLQFPEHQTDAVVLEGKWNQDADCVLLRCLTPLQCSPIPLRDLRDRGDRYTTRGFPDAKADNGLTMAGEVREFATPLTNYYRTGTSRDYKRALQLFSQEGAAGDGAPVKGLSGAPVIIGSAAVGLMRFALMRNGQAVAGTLYACSARDIVALDPERLGLRPSLAPMPTLAPEQATEMGKLLVDAFKDHSDNLRLVAKFWLGVTPEGATSPNREGLAPEDAGSPNKELEGIVSYLFATMAPRRPGAIEMLLRGAMEARPANDDLRKFCQTYFPQVMAPLDDDATIQNIQTALIALVSLKHVEEVKQIIGSYRRSFEDTRKQIGILAKYKELHNVLHEVQGSLLSVTQAIKDFKMGQESPLLLGQLASDLEKSAKKARKEVAALATEPTAWIDELDSCAADIKTWNSPAADEKILTVPQRLEGLFLKESTRINVLLVSAAQAVQLDNFADTMLTIVQSVAGQASDEALEQLRKGSRAVGILRSRLAAVVAEHNEWQELNTLRAAPPVPGKHWPQAKIPFWKQFKDRLIGLCDVFPAEDWSKELKKQMQPQWLTDGPPAEPEMERTARQIDYALWIFFRQCDERFFDVDSELNALCAKITQFGTQLDALLNVDNRSSPP